MARKVQVQSQKSYLNDFCRAESAEKRLRENRMPRAPLRLFTSEDTSRRKFMTGALRMAGATSGRIAGMARLSHALSMRETLRVPPGADDRQHR